MRLHHSPLPLPLILVFLAAPAFAQRLAPRLDYYGDPLPAGAVARLGTKRFQTKGGFGWTPDGKSLATLRGGTVYFWDLEDGHCRETLLVPINPDPFFTYGAKFALSSDGQKLVCADFYGGLATWDLATSQTASVAREAKTQSGANVAVALHPDGQRFITLHKNGELKIHDFATCKVQRLTKVKANYWSEDTPATFSPDGKLLALGQVSNDSIHLLDIDKDAEPLVIKRAHTQALYHLEFLADGRLVSVGAKRGPMGTADDPQPQDELLIWDLKQQPPTSREFPLTDTQPAGCSATFSADGKTLVTVHRDRLCVWDAPGEKLVRTIEGPHFRNAMRAMVAIDPTGKYVAVDDRENYVCLWELATGQPVLSTQRHHQGGIYAVDWSPSGERLATGDFAGEGRLWDAASGKPLASFRGPDFGIFGLRYTSDDTQIVVCGDQPPPGPPRVGGHVTGPVRWHDAESGKLVRQTALASRARLLTPTLDGSQWAAITSAFDDDAILQGTTIRVLDAKTGAETAHFTLEREESQPNALSWSADGKSLLVALNTKVVRFEAATGKALGEVELPHFWQDPVTKLLRPTGIGRAAFLGHGKQIVTMRRGEAYGWRLPAGEKLWTIPGEDGYSRVITATRDERLLATAVSGEDRLAKLRIFDLATRRLLATFDLGRDFAECAAFSPAGNRIVVGCIDGTALVYDVSDVK